MQKKVENIFTLRAYWLYMKFGKLKDLTTVDFTFAEDPIENQKLFDNTSQNKDTTRIFIGTTGWYNKE